MEDNKKKHIEMLSRKMQYQTENFTISLGVKEMRAVDGGYWEPIPNPDKVPQYPWEFDWEDIFICR